MKGRKRVIIDPGEYHVTNDNIILSTLLGSCVAACIWDPVNRVIGMNHFLLANRRYAQEMPVIVSEAGRYGIHAMELLINSMLRKGANRKLLRAKAFGGGNVLRNVAAGDSFYAVGDVNSRFIIEFLRNENIPLETQHLGGDFGRIIHFDAHDYSVYMKRIETGAEKQLVEEEKQYFRKEIAEHEREEKAKVDQGAGSIQYW
jgi:chemotaxis protein CheD